MSNQKPHRFKSIAEYHQVMGLPKPEHPLISVIDFEAIKHIPNSGIINYICDFYCISLKKDANAKMKYGQQKYDYDEGAMLFMSPGQVFGIEVAEGEELTFRMVIAYPPRFSLVFGTGKEDKPL